MKFEKRYEIDESTFKEREGYILICFECNENEMIIHYIKNGKNYAVAAPTFSEVIQLWNEELI